MRRRSFRANRWSQSVTDSVYPRDALGPLPHRYGMGKMWRNCSGFANKSNCESATNQGACKFDAGECVHSAGDGAYGFI